ncbi:NFX1-type zinc finger-containing protein 1-like isoform X2 [Leptidea sinapis]|uniref:NFX1-type zinc finger-containing protein 1-like isoform X2 n=1 Tax=Leptidea sinapis TaxID=189913 RepID=UPI0021C3DEDF|nr:NFX1-type zinc finger-containing protein 1-like isoform X2 [Leptidea sinapis]
MGHYGKEYVVKYLADPTKKQQENIWIYPKVSIVHMYVSNNKVGYLVDIARNERLKHKTVDCKQYAHNKRLMFGSLLLFTSDNFETILSASVLESSLSLLSDGYIAVTFDSPVSNTIFANEFLMIESEVFFEPYHRVLKVLQSFRTDELPMKEYIVDVQPKIESPAYLTSESIYSIRTEKSEEIYFPVLDRSQWPNKECFGLDQSQMDAFHFALTRDFAVIQGPPGTGKTFIGVKIASTILKNLSLEGTPMLIICYTNHALDQFLEGILSTTTSLVRLGSQSKSKILEPYSLSNLRSKVKSKYNYLYGKKLSELEKVFKEINYFQAEIEKCNNEIVGYNNIKSYLKVNENIHALKDKNDDGLLNWLLDYSENNTTYESDRKECKDWETQCADLTIHDKIETCFSEEIAINEIDSMKCSIKYVKDITDDVDERKKMIDKFNKQIEKIERRLDCFKKNIRLSREGRKHLNIGNTGDLYELTPEQRWFVYFNAVDCLKGQVVEKMKVLMERHKSLSAELEEVSTLIDSDVMKSVRVVGVTTTVAARRHDLMRKLLSPIVIVEEAAEVLEGHIVASLTNRCQQLILIGDHKQLRPTTACYKLATQYKLEISLFERMLRNGVHAKTLCTQRRLRPDFVKLLVPELYEKLDSHPVVCGYPNVRGMKNNLFFFNHDAIEDSGNGDTHSHNNTYEAMFCVELANYLRQRDYTSEDITILATYTGQATLVKQLSKKYATLSDIKVTVVDNFQGEESKIIILSLVRSNMEGSIGFLSASNRVCVALSRAKEGFYICGNMKLLKSASRLWRCINDKLVSMNAIGDRVALHCDRHQASLNIKEPKDFINCTKGPCLKNCNGF